MKKTNKELTTVQKLNRLPLGTCIRFKCSNGRIAHAEKIEGKGNWTEHGEAKLPIWSDADGYSQYYIKQRIPADFEVLKPEVVAIRRLKKEREMVWNWWHNGYCQPDEDVQRYKAKIAEIDREIAELETALQDGELLVA